MKTLGEIIKKYRQDHGLSMDGFSELSGLSKSYISMLEKNKRGNSGEAITPSLETIKSVANVLDMDFDELLKALDNDEEVKIGDDHLAKEKFETKENE